MRCMGSRTRRRPLCYNLRPHHYCKLADTIDLEPSALRHHYLSPPPPPPPHPGRDGVVGVPRLLSLLRSCVDPSHLRRAREAHAQIVAGGLDAEPLSTRLLGAYVLCRSFPDAKDVFFRLDSSTLSSPPPLPWNWMIRGLAVMGLFELALLFYFKMWFVGVPPDKYTFPYVVKSCCGLAAVGLGRLVHDTIREMDLESDVFVGSSLIKMYAESSNIDEAREVFDAMSERDCVCWNVMIDGYARVRDVRNAVFLFDEMRKEGEVLNSVSFTCVLSVCASEGMLNYGVQLHALAVKYGLWMETSVANTLLAMYSKCRCLDDVQRLFDLMPYADMVAWNGMISGYVQNGMMDEALQVFYRMQVAGMKPDSVTLASLLPAFSGFTDLMSVKEIHAYIVKNDVFMDAFLKSALIDLYFKCKHVRMAEKIFDATRTIDVVIFSAMISGYVLNGMSDKALGVFSCLLNAQLKPNAITLASVLPACACLATLKMGKELHNHILKHAYEGRCYVASALMDMYTKCGRLDLGHQIFVKMPSRDAVAWNSMISSFAQNGQPEEAIILFRQMGMEGLRYDCVSISSALSACSSIPALRYGKEIHGFMTRGGIKSDVFAESALIDMYAKCGNLDLARSVFDSMSEKNEVSWNSIIAAYGTHGLVDDAANLFQQMQEANFLPDHITFLALISACAHAGQVEEGFQFFHTMCDKYGITARMEHYACVVDLYGRAGQLNKGLEFIKGMPFEPDAGIWGAILGACRVHGNIDLAEIASNKLFELDPKNSGYYVLLSNASAVSGRWEGVLKARSLMKERKIQKVPGYSWIEINSINQMFTAADKTHPNSASIYQCLKSLLLVLREEGYIPKPDYPYPQLMDA